jgi:hypothetical protein
MRYKQIRAQNLLIFLQDWSVIVGLGQEKKKTSKTSVKSGHYFIRARTMNSFNLIEALMRLTFL